MTSTIIEISLDLLTVMVYSVLVTFSLIGTILYVYAYKHMKRSKIIGSIALLLGVISVDSLWWLMTTLTELHNNLHYTGFTHPIFIIIIKGLLAYGIVYFVIHSIRDESINDPITSKEQEKLF